MRDVHTIKHAVECGNLTRNEPFAHNQNKIGCKNLVKYRQEIGRRAKDHLQISYTYYHDNSKHACMIKKKAIKETVCARVNSSEPWWYLYLFQIDFHLPPYHKTSLVVVLHLPRCTEQIISHVLPPVHNVNCALVGYVGKQGTLLDTYLVQEILEKTTVLGITCLEGQKKKGSMMNGGFVVLLTTSNETINDFGSLLETAWPSTDQLLFWVCLTLALYLPFIRQSPLLYKKLDLYIESSSKNKL